jgi:hypothetical protein
LSAIVHQAFQKVDLKDYLMVGLMDYLMVGLMDYLMVDLMDCHSEENGLYQDQVRKSKP